MIGLIPIFQCPLVLRPTVGAKRTAMCASVASCRRYIGAAVPIDFSRGPNIAPFDIPRFVSNVRRSFRFGFEWRQSIDWPEYAELSKDGCDTPCKQSCWQFRVLPAPHLGLGWRKPCRQKHTSDPWAAPLRTFVNRAPMRRSRSLSEQARYPHRRPRGPYIHSRLCLL